MSSSLAAVLLIVALGASACGASAGSNDDRGSSAVPPEFRAACGHPGSTVRVAQVPVTVRHADCDLTGVTLDYQGAGVVVPTRGVGVGNDVDGPSGSPSIRVTVDATSGDVTVTG